MEKRFRVETLLAGDLAELYEAVMAQFERAGSVPLSEMNQTLLQTGLLMHLTMLTSIRAVTAQEARQLDELAEKVGGENLMWEIVELARRHWRADGPSGAVDLEA